MKELKEEFLELIGSNQGIIHKICRLYASPDDYQDLYQDILVSLWKGYPAFNGQARVSTWMYRVALYTALNYRRYSALRKFQPLENVVADVTPGPDEDTLTVALRHLSPDERALMMLYLDENSYREIGEILGISANNVGVKISRIKTKLGEIIKKI